MALTVTDLPRKFEIIKKGKKTELPEINKALSPAEVVKHYSGSHPELLNAEITGPTIENGHAVYQIKSEAGTLG